MIAAPTHSFPTSLSEWERVLTNALLRVNGAIADPIRSFEITPETIAQHCGLGSEYASAAEDAFRQALISDRNFEWSLKNGSALPPTAEVPNCMAQLSLSLLVDSLLDGDYTGEGVYRKKLSHWLRVEKSFMNLRGFAIMWEGLVAWLEERAKKDKTFRRLILPDAPESWNHIGYTRYLSFPAKRDVAQLRKILERNPDAAEDAIKLVALLDQKVNLSSVSFGMQCAFREFKLALRAGTASADHRFWRLVMRAAALIGHVERHVAELIMEFDEDGDRNYRVTAEGFSDEFPSSVGSAASLDRVQASSNLGQTVRRGILCLRRSGLASWVANGDPPVGAGPFHVAIAENHIRAFTTAHASLEASGGWYVTVRPLPGGTLHDLLERIGALPSGTRLSTIALVDGVRVGQAWLGQPLYLPSLNVTDCNIRISGGRPGVAELTCIDGKLKSSAPVEGDYTISDQAGTWSRRASFVALANVHTELSGSTYSLPLQQEWRLADNGTARCCESAPEWDEAPYEFQGMLEAIYARARSGVGEGELIELIAKSNCDRPWEVLRTLQESTFVDARLLERWRGRRFTLGRPTLVDVRIGGQPGIVVSGALSSRLEADFRETANLSHGKAFRRFSADSLAPPLIGATDVSSETLARALGWAIEKRPALPFGSMDTKLVETSVVGESYEEASAWDWETGRFCVRGANRGAVSLVRLVHPNRRDHDIYRVTGARTRSFTSRHAAILDAHRQGKRTMFSLEGSRIVRKSAEGALPLEIAKVLRFSTLANGGATHDGWAYSGRPADIRWLAGLLPGLIQNADQLSSTLTFSSRRGRGARRPVWGEGGVAS